MGNCVGPAEPLYLGMGRRAGQGRGHGNCAVRQAGPYHPEEGRGAKADMSGQEGGLGVGSWGMCWRGRKQWWRVTAKGQLFAFQWYVFLPRTPAW